MHKLLVVILSIFYLLSSSGVVVYEHYCMGELAQSSLSDDISDIGQCGKCGMEKNKDDDNGCCKDEQKFVKSNDQNPGIKLVIIKWLTTLADLPSYKDFCDTGYSLYCSNVNTCLPNAPPEIVIFKQPIFIRVQSLLI